MIVVSGKIMERLFFTDSIRIGKMGEVVILGVTIVRRKSNEQLIEDFTAVHGDKYDYSNVEYKNNRTKIKIHCLEHNNDFMQSATSHLAGFSGCPDCYAEKTRGLYANSKQDFIRLASTNHDLNKFDFSDTEYVSSHIKVKIRCRKHDNTFEITPNSFHRGANGCRDCFSESSRVNRLDNLSEDQENESCNLYHLQFIRKDGTSFEKVGITKREIKDRFNKKFFKDEDMQINVLAIKSTTMIDALRIEEQIIEELRCNDKLYRVHDFKNTPVGGWTECFEEGVIDLQSYFR